MKQKYLAMILLCYSTIAMANTYTVTNNLDDTNAGSLRWAIAQANANFGADEITFSADFIITIDASLTLTDDETTINAGSNDITIQPGSTISGIIINGASCVIQGLHMRGFANAPNAAILVDGSVATANEIYACKLGVTLGGNTTDAANYSGIYINNGATGTVIGDGTLAGANVIGGNSFGIRIAGASNSTVISGNRIGIGLDGDSNVGNTRGIDISGSTGTLIGVAGELVNIISHNGSEGIRINGSTNTNVINSYIGVDATGVLDRGNGAQGVYLLNGSDGSQIGAITLSARNIISGNTNHGIEISDTYNVTVYNNYIGLGADGTTALPNNYGIRVDGTSSTIQIGNGASTGRNLISANSIGISIGGGSVAIHGNLIGLDETGTIDRGNSGAGISLAGGSGEVGGDVAGEGNIISGNNYGIGISIGGFDILANFIGTSLDGSAAIPNDNEGIRLGVGSGTNIGNGTEAGANVISGNTLEGILVFNASATSNTIHMNYIGLQADGESPLGNGSDGILIESQATSNTFQENIIAYNGGDGIEVTDCGTDQNWITQNSIYSNTGEAILVSNSAQSSISLPVINSTYNGLISGTSANDATIELFADTEDESQQYLGATTADGSGNWNHQIDVALINDGFINISATQTASSNTSELISASLELPFITTWTAPANGELTIYKSTGMYNYDLVWTNLTSMGVGDGSINAQTGNYTITGLTAGHIYQIEISGLFPWFIADLTGAENMLTVEQWGNIAWADMTNMFAQATYLDVNAIDAPDLSNVISMDHMFWNCTNLSGNFNHWNVSSITNMQGLFRQATNFDENLSNWEVDNVQNMGNMFSQTKFDQDISSWEVGEVASMSTMFNGTSFNQDISGWDVSKVTDMSSMFSNNAVFNQNLSAWGDKLGMVDNMGTMFINATAFDQSLAAWDISNVTYMVDMLDYSAISEANYDATLIAWAALPSVQSGVELGASGLTYCAGSSARDDLIGDGWTFSEDINNCPFLSYSSGIDLTNYVSFDGTPFGISTYETTPRGITFSNDGTKMYVVGTSGDEVNQFALTTPFETTSGITADGIFGGLSNPNSIVFNNDGTKMYTINNVGFIYQYSLSVPFDINTAPTSDGNIDISLDGAATRGLCFNHDGSLLYVVNETDDQVNQYTVTTPFDLTAGISSATPFDISGETTQPQDIAFNQDGSKMFIIGTENDAINQYSLSVPFDLTTTPTHDGSLDVGPQQGNPTGLEFNPQGTKLFIIGSSLDRVSQFTLGDAIREVDANDGSVAGSIIFTIEGDTFTPTGGTLTYNTDYTISNALLGLTPNMTISDDGTFASFTLSGNASSHDNIDVITDLEFTFNNSAFTGNDASNIGGATAANSGFGVTLYQNEYVVTNTDNDGSGSLRQAILDARDTWHPTTISFNLSGDGSGSSWTITPTTELDDIGNYNGFPVTIDGTTQTGWDRVTDRMIVIQDAGDLYSGLYIDGDEGHEIYGLKIQGFDIGITSSHLENVTIGASGKSNVLSGNETGIYSEYPNNNNISYNYIGTDVTGSSADPNNIGLDFGYNYSESYDNYFTNNVISGNTQIGLAISYSDNFVQNNKIGISDDESTAIPNGIGVWVQASGFIEDNIISGNTETGIWMQTPRNGNEIHIRRNYIGRNTAGTALPNGTGITSELDEGDPPTYSDSPIIGGAAGEGNFIAYNLGVAIQLNGNAYMETIITDNSIYENGASLELLHGADGGIDPPMITSVTASTISGTVGDNTTGTIHIYEVDPVSGNQGKTFVDSEAVNDFTWSVTSPPTFDPGKIYTATVTTDTYGTSEFWKGTSLLNATDITTAGFTANWIPISGATELLIDVDDDEDFSSPLITGQSLAAGGTASVSVGLSAGINYYYRLQADLGTFVTPISDASVFMVAPGHALDFDGDNDYVRVSDPSALDFGSGDFTFELWFKPNDLTPSSRYFLSKDQAGQRQFGFQYDRDFTGNNKNITLLFYRSDDSFSGLDSDANAITDTDWHHVAGVRRGDDLELYVDGQLIKSGVNLGTSGGSMASSTSDFLIGANSGLTAFADAQIDEVRIWGVARTQSEINDHMFESLTGNESNLIAYYRFDQGIAFGDNTSPAIDVLPDRSQNQNDGTLFGFSLDGSSSNWVDADNRFTPIAPTNLRVVEVSPTQIDLIWDDNSSNETEFRIEVAEGRDYDFVGDNLIVTTGSNGTATATHSITSVSAENTYRFRVRARNTFGYSDYSNAKAGNTITHPGHALSFDGVDDFVDLGDVLDELFIGADKSFSIESWIYLTDIGSSGEIIFSKQGNSNCAVDERQMTFGVREDGIIRFGYFGDLALTQHRTIGGNTVLNLNEWYHVAVTYDGAADTNDGLDRVKLYVNGVEETTSMLTSTGVLPSEIPDGPAHLAIGSNISSGGTICGGTDQIFSGAIDEIRLWDDIRSQPEIESNMFNTLLGNESELAVYFKFDQGEHEGNNTFDSFYGHSINQLPDRSSNQNDGTLNNFTLNGDNSNWVTSDVGPNSFTVTNTNDAGIGSLRWAIDNANADSDLNTITFNIPTSDPNYEIDDVVFEEIWTISPATDLPPITEAAFLNAESQPGDGDYRIKIDGQGTLDFGLQAAALGVEIAGFNVTNFNLSNDSYGIGVDMTLAAGPNIHGNLVGNSRHGIFIGRADGSIIKNNIVGFGEQGSAAGNTSGIKVESNAQATIIGGLGANEGNIVAWSTQSGIDIADSDNSLVLGNYIGTNASGTSAQPNDYGLDIYESHNVNIQGNVISGNNIYGIALYNSDGITIFANIIGMDASGTNALPNGDDGISSSGNTTNLTVGGTGVENTIAHNSGSGINLDKSTDLGNDILANAIFCNGSGIYLNGQGNNDKQPPVIESVTSTSVSGTAGFFESIHVYRDNDCTPSQGKEYLGMANTADATSWNLSGLTIDIDNDIITATATSGTDGTSEFAMYEPIVSDLTHGVSEQDYVALIALYNDTEGDNWTVNSNWLSSNDVDTWYGIEVADERVENIYLSENNLVGTIPTEIGDLTDLVELRLNKNQISGAIPTEIGELLNLTDLEIYDNQLTGEIPDEIWNLTNLNYLYLGENQLSGSISSDIGNLTELMDLYLDTNELTGSIPTELGDLVNLVDLDLDNNQLNGSIPTELENLINLEELELTENQFTGSIPTELGSLTNLIKLELSDNQLTGTIPTEIRNLTQLTSLLLDYNELTGSIPSWIDELSLLEEIELDNNQLSGNIPTEIGSLINLVELDLNDNQLTGSIPSELGALTLLIELELDDNQLSGDFPTTLENLTLLEEFSIDHNEITGAIPAGFVNMTNLIYFEVDDNQLDDFPDLSSLTQLMTLEMEENNFHFDDIEPNIGITGITYSPQSIIAGPEDQTVDQCGSLDVTIAVGGNNNLYQWYKDETAMSNQTSNQLSIAEIETTDAGVYYLEITNSVVTGLVLTSEEFEVTVNEIQPTITEVGVVFGTVELMSSEGDSYQWYENDNPMSGETNQNVFVKRSVFETASHTVEVFHGDCSTISDPYIRSVLSVEPNASEELKIWPNPTSSMINISKNEMIIRPLVIRLYNITGVVLAEIDQVQINQRDFVFDLSTYSNGVYFIGTNHTSELTRVIKK
ncbi:BspA family leucine-rich repeat surface protein [Reichenbachiella sp.]|uniref:BspA family leucine-rich repeat surface protein n=1 Tax=Reichenbachiella sp. TaxID=2184521 RepID=UPI003296F3EA